MQGTGAGVLLDASAATLPVQLVGGVGDDDTLFGGTGSDFARGGARGNDFLAGGPGNDTYVFGPGTLGSDSIHEAENADEDALDFSTFGGPVTIDLGLVGVQDISPGLLTLSFSGPAAIEGAFLRQRIQRCSSWEMIALANRLYGAGGCRLDRRRSWATTTSTAA